LFICQNVRVSRENTGKIVLFQNTSSLLQFLAVVTLLIMSQVWKWERWLGLIRHLLLLIVNFHL